jgi:hypothetical protein
MPIPAAAFSSSARFHARHGSAGHLVHRVDLGNAWLMHIHAATVHADPFASFT